MHPGYHSHIKHEKKKIYIIVSTNNNKPFQHKFSEKYPNFSQDFLSVKNVKVTKNTFNMVLGTDK